MLDKKFEGRKSIWFEWWNAVVGLEGAETLHQTGGETRCGIKAADFRDANRIDEILAKDGREFEVWG
jgi:hypothetical protein